MPPALADFLATVIAFTVREIAKNLDVIYAAWQRAATTTLTDAQPDPKELDALRKEQADAIAAGKLPP
jgi:hypothetical protein